MHTRLWLFVRFLFAFSASYFSLLAQRTSNQKKCTPASASSLRYSVCRASIETQPGSSHKARELLRDSDSRWPTTPANPALLGAADGDPKHHATATVSESKKQNLVFEPFAFMPCEFGENNPIPSR